MRENTLKRIWASGGVTFGVSLSIPSAYSTEVLAHQGWDDLMIDMQHGNIDYATACSMLTAMSTTSTIPLVRVPWRDPAIIMRMLDAGSYGIICPMVNSREDAEHFVAACRYPPAGQRSFGPVRAGLYGGQDYVEQANETVLTIAMIETGEALDNLDDILSTPSLDAVYIGPSDLAMSLGRPPGPDQEESTVFEAIKTVATKARQHDVVAGIFNRTPAYTKQTIELGFQFITIRTDIDMMAQESSAALSSVRDLMARA